MRSLFNLRDLLVKAHPEPDWHFIPFTGHLPVMEKLPSSPAPFRFAWKYYPDCDHGALPVPAQFDALRFTCSFYSIYFPFPELFQPDWTQDQLLEDHYKLISYYMGYNVPPPEVTVNDIGYRLLGAHQLDRAAYYFQLNIENYPNSFNVYDSMGDLLAAKKEDDSAVKCYQQSLFLHENPGTREKMEKLRRQLHGMEPVIDK
jgi:tetratricopeptide (TPR) repeat protein